MQYLITGAAGFIGSYLCHKLAKEGNKVIAVDSFSNYYDVGLKNNRVKALLEPLKVDVINDFNNKNDDKMRLLISQMEQRLNKIYDGGGKKRIEKLHEQGKMSARERIDFLLDKNTPRFEIFG